MYPKSYFLCPLYYITHETVKQKQSTFSSVWQDSCHLAHYRGFNLFPNKPCSGQYKAFENTVGKGEIARSKQFILFPQCFQSHLENLQAFSSNLLLSSANFFGLDESKICRLGRVKVRITNDSSAQRLVRNIQNLVL